jgi:sugar/nucleoside kinase (ribokinase family)
LAVTGIGNAMLDIISQDSNEVYRQLGLVKAAMSLIQEDQLETFFNAMGPTIQMSGGSVANSIAGVAALGGTCGYIGKVADDDFGKRFTHDLTSMGVEVDLAIAAADEGATGRCHVFITDDAQRTMATYLGASNQLRVSDINETLIARSEITYVEGYLFDLPPAKEAIRKVVNFAHDYDSMVALSLSDMFCVDRHRRDFLELVTNDVDVLLCNETEICSLFQVPTLDRAFALLEELGILAVVTRGPSGADVLTVTGVVSVPAHEVENVIDQNGAGDMFASGFLYGLALGADPVESAELGSLCAGEIISHLGARPENDLEELAIEAGLL